MTLPAQNNFLRRRQNLARAGSNCSVTFTRTKSFPNHVIFLSKPCIKQTSFSLPHCTRFSRDKLSEQIRDKYLSLVSFWRCSDSPIANVAEEATQHRNGPWIVVLHFLHMTTAVFNYIQWKANAAEVNTWLFCLLHANLIPAILNCATFTTITQNVCCPSCPAV